MSNATIAILSKDVAKDLLLTATGRIRNTQEGYNLFWNTMYNSEFVKCDIPFDPEWSNSTGYYDGAVDAELPQLEIGEVARSRAPGNNARRILIIKTRFGNVVLFERYTPGEDDELKGPIVQNTPRLVHKSEMFKAAGALKIDDLIDALGDGWCNDNVGLRLENFFYQIEKAAARKARLAAPGSIEADIARADDAS